MVDEPRGEEAPTLSRGLVIPTLAHRAQARLRRAGGRGAVSDAERALRPHLRPAGLGFSTRARLRGRGRAARGQRRLPDPPRELAAQERGALRAAQGLPAREQVHRPRAQPLVLPHRRRGAALPADPARLKVVLIASPTLYQELHEADPEFSQLFKVQARFEPTLSLDEAIVTYPAFLAGLARDRGLPPLTPDAVAALLFHGGCVAESQTKVTAQLGLIAEVVTEAGYRAAQRGQANIDGSEVDAGPRGGATARQPLSRSGARAARRRDDPHRRGRRARRAGERHLRAQRRAADLRQARAASRPSSTPASRAR
jgi:hypothetical protein